MLNRRSEGRKPQIVFTADFHELVRGDLIPGPLVLRYDPFRIVPEAEVPTLPATQRPILVECRFHPGGEIWQTELHFREAKWIQVEYDPTGQGTMLETAIPLPDGCDELEFWFTYTDAQGKTHVDSAEGANYWLRFPAHDLTITHVGLLAVPNQPLNTFSLDVLSVPDIETVTVRWRYTAYPDHPREERSLIATVGADGTKAWSTKGGLPVAAGTPIAFDLVYTDGPHRYTDDNEGTWYVVTPQLKEQPALVQPKEARLHVSGVMETLKEKFAEILHDER